ncbi:MAG: ABC transporter ATP-binding protein [Candidatus Bathyarchaeia archaeon]
MVIYSKDLQKIMSQIKLSIKNVTKIFPPNVKAVNNVTLEIYEHELVAILGPSGCGKSTLLHLIAGFERPTHGKVFLDGRDITDLPPWKRGIGIIFQGGALFPHMTVKENIAYGLKNRHLPKREITAKILQALQLVGLTENYLKKYPAQLSGGERQRVALIRTLVIEPTILLLDEPLTGLDKRIRDKLEEELQELHNRLKFTGLYVTHNQEEAMVLGNRIAVMNQGSVIQIGFPEQLYEAPVNEFVASFFGDMNFIPAAAIRTDGAQSVLQLLGGHSFVIDRSLPNGDLVIGIRPERIMLLLTAAPPKCNSIVLEGIVQNKICTGEKLRFTIDVHGYLLRVTTLNAGAAREIQIGTKVNIGWDVMDMICISKRG